MADKTIQLKKCERCGSSFKCNADDINNCFCNNISLSENAKEKIAKLFSDCLCENCLRYFETKYN